MFNQPLDLIMNTTCCPSTTTPMAPVKARPLIGTWVKVARDFWSRLMPARQRPMSEHDLTALDGLSAETLKDIGAPEWMLERAQRSENRAHQEGLFERDSINWR